MQLFSHSSELLCEQGRTARHTVVQHASHTSGEQILCLIEWKLKHEASRTHDTRLV